MTTTKAVILEDGEVLSESYLDKYAIKSEGSNKIPSDTFKSSYKGNELIEPLYNIEALAQLLELNTYHYRSVKTKARDIAGIGWSLVPKEDVDNPNQEEKDIGQEFLEKCNPIMTLSEINDKVMVDHEATGNGYFEIIRSEDGERVIGLEHIPAHTVRVHSDMNKFIQIRGKNKVWFKRVGYEKDLDYQTGEYHEKGSLNPKRRATEIMQIKNYTSRSDYYGIPDVVPALSAILGDKERQEYNTSFFDNHAIPAYAVTVTGAELDEETENQIKKFFQQDVKKSNHSTLVLTAKNSDADYDSDPIQFDFQALSTDVKEMSFRMFRQDNRDEILSSHGVPPYRAGITVEGQLGGSSAMESTEIYKQSIVKPKQEVLESRINRFILKEGLDIHDWVFRFSEIDTRDEDKEIERLKTLFDIGYYSPNMLREERGDERIDDPNMDRHFINGNPIDTTEEEASMIMNSMKQLHSRLIDIATKDGGASYPHVDKRSESEKIMDRTKDFDESQRKKNKNG